MATQRQYLDSDGTYKPGYIIDGKTYVDPEGTTRVPIGARVAGDDGKWYMMTQQGGTEVPAPQSAPQQPQSTSNLLDQQKASLIQAARAQHQASVNTLNAQAEKIPTYYKSVKNQAAGQSQVGRLGFNETANALGLSSGAMGQAELSRGNQLQRTLSAADSEQAGKLSDVALQRANLETGLSSTLSNIDAQIASQALSQYNADLSRADALSQYAQNRADNLTEFGASREDTAYARAATAAQASGIYSGMAQFGWTPEQISAAERAYALSNVRSSGGYGGGGAPKSSVDFDDVYAKMKNLYNVSVGKDGKLNEAGKRALQNYASQYGGEYAGQLLSSFGLNWTGNTQVAATANVPSQASSTSTAASVDTGSLIAAARGLLAQNRSTQYVRDYIADLYDRGMIKQSQVAAVVQQLGI